jgi:SulP family sulfate permease
LTAEQPPIPDAGDRPAVFRPKLLTTLIGYDRRTAVGDLLAGLTVAMVALPLSIAIAIASGARPEAGLVTAIVGGLLISLLGGSRVQIGGPTGAFIVVVASVVSSYGFSGLLTATFMAGGILVLAALARVGALIKFIPEAVINGFTMGIAVIIAVSQLPDALGRASGAHAAELIPALGSLWRAGSAAGHRPPACAFGRRVDVPGPCEASSVGSRHCRSGNPGPICTRKAGMKQATRSETR